LDGQSEKRDPLDFALWKAADISHLMQWPSPWGMGFPGWHLECSVMSTKYLGETFDIHGGGMDLKFPHHECEIAQNVACNGESQPVKYWMHGNMLTVNGRKMAKSEGNGFTPEELITGNHKLLEQGYSPMTVRFFMLMGHYASTLDFSNEALQAAEKGLAKLEKAVETLATLEPSTGDATYDVQAFAAKCSAAMNDDFNTPILIATLFDGVKAVNGAAAGRVTLSAKDLESLQSTFQAFLRDVLGLASEASQNKGEGGGDDAGALLDLLVDMRANAKTNKDWGTADKIRDFLAAQGITIQDGKDGSSWSRG
jgi:cysteinyl-tRNA synthetase